MGVLYGVLSPLIPITGAIIAAIVIRSRRAKIAASSEAGQDLPAAPGWVKVGMWCLVALVGMTLVLTVAILVLAH